MTKFFVWRAYVVNCQGNILQTEERCCWQQCGPCRLCQIVLNHTSVPAARRDLQREPPVCCSHHHSCSASVLCATAGAAEYRVKCTLQFPVTSAVILNSGHCTVMLNSVYLLRHIRFSSWKVSAISSIDIILVKQLQLHISGTLEVNCYTELAENGSKIACVEHCLAQLQCWFCLNGLALNHGKLNVKPFRFLCTSCLTLICQKVHNGKWCTL